MPLIDKKMTIRSILDQFPDKSAAIAAELTRSGLQCTSCQAAVWETLEAGMLAHGKKVHEIDALLERLEQIVQQTSDPTTITLTERAAQKFAKIAEEEGVPGAALRIGLRPGGCSGFSYDLEFSTQRSERDHEFLSSGIQIHVDDHFVGKLRGAVVDYAETLYDSGFRISNPHVRYSCGCGSSYSFENEQQEQEVFPHG